MPQVFFWNDWNSWKHFSIAKINRVKTFGLKYDKNQGQIVHRSEIIDESGKSETDEQTEFENNIQIIL